MPHWLKRFGGFLKAIWRWLVGLVSGVLIILVAGAIQNAGGTWASYGGATKDVVKAVWGWVIQPLPGILVPLAFACGVLLWQQLEKRRTHRNAKQESAGAQPLSANEETVIKALTTFNMEWAKHNTLLARSNLDPTNFQQGINGLARLQFIAASYFPTGYHYKLISAGVDYVINHGYVANPKDGHT